MFQEVARDIAFALRGIELEEERKKAEHALRERVKELSCLYGISSLVERPLLSLAEIFQGTVNIIPSPWQYPEIACARIILESQEFRTENFTETIWKQASDITVQGEWMGSLQVCYLEERPASDEGPFLKEERRLLNAIAEQLGRIIDLKRREEVLREERSYLENLINHANAPIIVWIPDSRISRFNRAFEGLSGYTADEVIGQEFSMLFPEQSRDQSLTKIARTLSGEYWESVEVPILRKDGEIRLALWNSANIYAEDGTTLLATIAPRAGHHRSQAGGGGAEGPLGAARRDGG